MRPEPLFLSRCSRMASLLQSSDEAEVLELAAIMRQLILDKHSLFAVVNLRKIPIRFRVVRNDFDAFASMPSGPPAVRYVRINPVARMNPDYIVKLTHEEFLQHKSMYVGVQALTVKELIRHAAHVAGGIHYDPQPKPEYERVNLVLGGISAWDLPMEVFLLREIATVVLEALEPLRLTVQESEARREDQPA